jgi:hypothetical protein
MATCAFEFYAFLDPLEVNHGGFDSGIPGKCFYRSQRSLGSFVILRAR